MSLQTAFITHTDCIKHEMGDHHPESPARLSAILERFNKSGLMDQLQKLEAPLVRRHCLTRVHTEDHVDKVEALSPSQGYAFFDADTAMNQWSLVAAQRAAGAAVFATDLVAQGKANGAFCAVRPPGHHAMNDKVMGFCFFNNIAVGVAHALEEYGAKRVAILDFDVHHGNGTEDIFYNDKRVMLCSTFQYPFYPYSGIPASGKQIINTGLPAGTQGTQFREAILNSWVPALEEFKPEYIFVSAGFDAHKEDNMAYFNLNDDDFQWISQQVKAFADTYCPGRIVSMLEGGYEIDALARCVEIHVRELAGL